MPNICDISKKDTLSKCERKPSKGLNFYLQDKREPVVYLLKAQELQILSDTEFLLTGGLGLELPFYSTFKFQDLLKSPAELQSVTHTLDLNLRFNSEFHSLVTSKLELPIYNTGIYQLNDVVITDISVQPSCCCGKVDVLKMKGFYTCVSNEPVYSIPECCGPTIVLPANPKVPECDSRCAGDNWRQIPSG
jgi:hypothetical protein